MVNIFLLTLTLVIPRQEVIDSAFSNANVEWACDSINAAPVLQCNDWYSDYQVGHTYHGVAYEYGGWDDPQRFLYKLSQGLRAGSHSDNDCITYGGDPSWATGQDCSGFVSRVWQLHYKHSTRMLPNITYPISYDSLKMGDAVNHPGHHVVLFYHWVDLAHTRFYIFQATDRRPNPSTTGLDLRYVSHYRNSYTPIRYPELVDSIIQDTLPNDTLTHDTLTTNPAQCVYKSFISFMKPKGLTKFNIKMISTNGAVVFRKFYGTVSDSMVIKFSPNIPTGVYFLRVDDGDNVYLRKKIIFFYSKYGGCGGTRTRDHLIHSQVLLPTELRTP